MGFPLYEVSRVVTFIDTESRKVVTRGWEERKWGVSVYWRQFQFGKMKRIWR